VHNTADASNKEGGHQQSPLQLAETYPNRLNHRPHAARLARQPQLPHPPDPPADEASRSNCGNDVSPVVVHHAADEAYNLRAVANHKKRQHHEAQESSREDCGKEMAESHLGHAGGEDEQLEGRRWRQHGRQHDREKFMAVEGCLDLVEALRAHAFDQQDLAAFIPDQIDDDTAQRRTGRRHRRVQEQALRVGPDISGHDGVERHAQKSGVHHGESQYAPDAERLQHRQNQQGPFVEKVLQDGCQLPVISGQFLILRDCVAACSQSSNLSSSLREDVRNPNSSLSGCLRADLQVRPRLIKRAAQSAALPALRGYTDGESAFKMAKELNDLQKKPVRVEALSGRQKNRKNSAALSQLRAAAHSQDAIVLVDYVLHK
jgi:hypothetical protein